ncbi:hypothetical protein PHSC3_001821 [Chlamydiales bacterium STE3]|nr:hypothetical protein PHSC3_001821 [Chlamydiales bacterium STE3]
MLNTISIFSINVFKGFGNTLFNGFESDIKAADKASRIGVDLIHLKPLNKWTIVLVSKAMDAEEEKNRATLKELGVFLAPKAEETQRFIVDTTTKEKYCDDSSMVLRIKCSALFFASFLLQPIGITLNVLNKIGKIVSLAQLWHPTEEKARFTARLAEFGKDIAIVGTSPLILIGMIFSSFYGATLSPRDGRKLYATLERLTYSGGYQRFPIGGEDSSIHNFLLAPCFQPEPKAHLGGGPLGQPNVW